MRNPKNQYETNASLSSMSRIWMRHVTHLHASCHKYEWDMWNMHMSHVTNMNWICKTMYESCHTCEWDTSHVYMSNVRKQHMSNANNQCQTKASLCNRASANICNTCIQSIRIQNIHRSLLQKSPIKKTTLHMTNICNTWQTHVIHVYKTVINTCNSSATHIWDRCIQNSHQHICKRHTPMFRKRRINRR